MHLLLLCTTTLIEIQSHLCISGVSDRSSLSGVFCVLLILSHTISYQGASRWPFLIKALSTVLLSVGLWVSFSNIKGVYTSWFTRNFFCFYHLTSLYQLSIDKFSMHTKESKFGYFLLDFLSIRYKNRSSESVKRFYFTFEENVLSYQHACLNTVHTAKG